LIVYDQKMTVEAVLCGGCERLFWVERRRMCICRYSDTQVSIEFRKWA